VAYFHELAYAQCKPMSENGRREDIY